jgi:NAD(P)-dependent dehydrogenase (short-subunit alcohol dehydrogenase family)
MTAHNSPTRVALVTGASSGMGKAFARALHDEGLVVYAAARRLEQMDDLRQLGIHTLQMDITCDEQVRAAVERIQGRHDAVDVLINNAGFGLYGAMEETGIDEARYQFEVNLFGLARLTQLLLPAMRERRSGRIINISSMGGRVYTPLGSWYHASKHALEGWSDCLRLELGPFGIDVVIIEPGVISTEFGEVMVTPLLQRSGSGAYAPMAQAMATATRSSYAVGGGSDPQVISALILHAVRARRPKTRYIAGKYARPMLFIRKWFGDRLFDKLVLSTVK